MKILGRRGQRGHEYVHADRPAEGEQAQEPERNGASATEVHRRRRPLAFACLRSRIREAQEPVPDRFEQAKRARQVLVRDLVEDDVANFEGYALDLIDCPTSARRQDKALRAAIGAVLAALDEARIFERVEQTDERGSIERQGSGQLILPHRRFGPRDPKQGQPRRLCQPIDLQTAVDRAAPFPRHMGDERRQSSACVFWSGRHERGIDDISERVEQADERGSIERQESGQLILPHRRFGSRDPKQVHATSPLSPMTCKRPSTARRHSRATWAMRSANRARASFGAGGMSTG